MSDQSGWTPEQHLQAAFDHLGRAARQWATDARQALEPITELFAGLGRDPAASARLRHRAEEDVALACDCDCARVHPDSWVCEVKAVTTIRRSSHPAGRVEVPVCAPCAAEVMARQL